MSYVMAFPRASVDSMQVSHNSSTETSSCHSVTVDKVKVCSSGDIITSHTFVSESPISEKLWVCVYMRFLGQFVWLFGIYVFVCMCV